jgi:flavin reductase (DIM6/NTAB) family NADH-FMN oxidoreductase RutF
MPRSSELLGPFPPGVDEEEYDRRRRRILWQLPTGLYLLGSRADGRRNFMTQNLVTQVAMAPKLLAVAVEESALTRTLIDASGAFALSVLRREDRELVRKFARPAIEDAGAATLSGAPFLDAPVTGSPVLTGALAFLDCEVRERLELGSHVLYVGEVVDVGGSGEAAEVLRMEDTRMNYGG